MPIRFTPARAIAIIAGLLIAIVLFIGIKYMNKQRAFSTASWSGQSWSGRPGGLLGIDSGDLDFITLVFRDTQGVAIAVWSDANGANSNGGDGPDRAYQNVTLNSPDDRPVKYSVEVREGRKGSLKIGDAVYDTAKGNLFLICTRAAKPQVLQMEADLLAIPKDTEGLKAYGRANAKILGFFEGMKNVGK